MTPAMDTRRFSRRTKTLEVTALGDGRYEFEAVLLDESCGGRYEEQARDRITIHHFVITGTAAGAALQLQSLSVMQNRLVSAGLLGLRERSVQVSGQQPQRVRCITRTFA